MKETLIYASNGDVKLTGSLLVTTLKSFLVRGGQVGPDGSLALDMMVKVNNPNKLFTASINLGGASVFSQTTPATTQTIAWIKVIISNRHSTGSSIVSLYLTSGDYAQDGVVAAYALSEGQNAVSLDTTADQALTWFAQLFNASDTYEVLAFTVRVVA